MAAVTIRGVEKYYGSHKVIHGVDVDIAVPVDDDFDATFCLIRHGIGVCRPQ